MRSLSFIALFLSLLLIALLLVAINPATAIDDRTALYSASVVIAVYLFVYALTVTIKGNGKWKMEGEK